MGRQVSDKAARALGLDRNIRNWFLIKGGRVRATNDHCFKYAGK